MTKQQTRRYQIWTLAKEHPAELGTPARPLIKVDADSATSLYHYGLPLEIELPGLCILPNGRSAACKSKKISSETANFIYDLGVGGYRLTLPENMPLGSLMHLDLDRLGEFYGALTSQTAEGFQIAVDGDCKVTLSNRLALLASALRDVGIDDGSGTTKPSVTRLEPEIKGCRFTDQSGAVRKGTVINVSQVDALIKTAIVPPVGTHLIFGGPGRYAAEVTRGFEIGFAVKFCPPIPNQEFSAAIKLTDD